MKEQDEFARKPLSNPWHKQIEDKNLPTLGNQPAAEVHLRPFLFEEKGNPMQLRQAWAKAERLRLDIQYRSYSTGAIRRQDPLIDTIELLIIIDPDNLCQNAGSESGIAMVIMTHLGLTDVHGRNSANASGLFDGEPVDLYERRTA